MGGQGQHEIVFDLLGHDVRRQDAFTEHELVVLGDH